MKCHLVVALGALASCLAIQAQPSPSAEIKQGYNRIKTNLSKAAEKVPEDQYGFKPSPDIRSFGELIGHIATAQIRTCNAVLGEQTAAGGAKTSKADLVAALKDSFTACDKAFDSLTDANLAQGVKIGQREISRITALIGMLTHSNEEYGYLAVYMRLKGVVPPSSEGR